MKYILEKLGQFFTNNQTTIIQFLGVLIIGFIIIKVIIKMMNRFKIFRRLDETVVSILKGIVVFFIYAIYLITLLSILGVPMTTFVAILSAMGLAVALALQGNLSNFAGAIMILTFKPFKVGDFIDSQGTMGTVKEIQLFFTHLLTPDNRKVIIPNSELVNARVTNFTSEARRRIDLIFGVSYDSDIEYVKTLILEIIHNNEMILSDPEAVVRLANHNSSSLDYDVKVWVEKDNYWAVRYDLHEQIKTSFDEHNISIPFPQRDIHLIKDNKDDSQ